MIRRSDAAGLGALGRQADAGPAAEDGPAGRDLGAEALQTLFAGEAHGEFRLCEVRGLPKAYRTQHRRGTASLNKIQLDFHFIHVKNVEGELKKMKGERRR